MNFNKYPEHSSCSGKKQYNDVLMATDAGRAQMYNNGFKIQLYIYECEYCKKYHLTQQKTEMPVLDWHFYLNSSIISIIFYSARRCHISTG